MPGMNVSVWDGELQDWRQVTRHDERPCGEALWLYRSLLLAVDEPASYEWKEGDARFRIERWSRQALDIARRQYPLLFRDK
jgi:hypothetical protein